MSLPRTHNLSKVLYVTSSGTRPFFLIKTTTSIAYKVEGEICEDREETAIDKLVKTDRK